MRSSMRSTVRTYEVSVKRSKELLFETNVGPAIQP